MWLTGGGVWGGGLFPVQACITPDCLLSSNLPVAMTTVTLATTLPTHLPATIILHSDCCQPRYHPPAMFPPYFSHVLYWCSIDDIDSVLRHFDIVSASWYRNHLCVYNYIVWHFRITNSSWLSLQEISSFIWPFFVTICHIYSMTSVCHPWSSVQTYKCDFYCKLQICNFS